MTSSSKTQIQVGGIPIEITRKRMKRLILKIRSPSGEVRVSAPRGVSLSSIVDFVSSKLEWVVEHQERVRSRGVPREQEYTRGEVHPLWGQEFSLLFQHPSHEVRKTTLEDLYKTETKRVALELIKKWEQVIGVKVELVEVRHLKSKWGSCHTRKRKILLNSELARRRVELLDYVVVHELTHLLEASHNHRFKALMSRFLPHWRQLNAELKLTSR